jgi:outer membrane protein TolC
MKTKARFASALILIAALSAGPAVALTPEPRVGMRTTGPDPLAGPGAPAVAQERKVLNLSLQDCLVKALRTNLSVAVEKMSPELAGHAMARAKEMFLPQFSLSYGNERQENASNWWIQGAGTITSKLFDYGVSVSELIPTGGTVALSLSSYKSDTNQAFQLINPRFGSTLRFDFSQPLLKNFGTTVTRQQVLQASKNVDIAEKQLETTMLDTVYLVQEAYWNLVYAVENLAVKQQSLHLGRDLLAKNKKEVEFGQLAPLEILNAESVVAQREADLIQAEGLISRGEEVLKSLINLSAEGNPQAVNLVPSDRPDLKPVTLDYEAALKDALANRPDLEILRSTLDSKEIALAVARNQTLPSLDLNLSYWSPGISGDQLIYPDGDFFSAPIGKIPGSAGDSLRDAFKLLYNNWNVGLTLSVPMGNIVSKAGLSYARADLTQSRMRLQNLEQQVALDVSDSLRTVETNFKRVEAYRVARELAEKSLDAEVKKLEVGLSTNYFVFEFQDRLANARSVELRAEIDAILSIERLERAVGLSLDKRGLKIAD